MSKVFSLFTIKKKWNRLPMGQTFLYLELGKSYLKQGNG